MVRERRSVLWMPPLPHINRWLSSLCRANLRFISVIRSDSLVSNMELVVWGGGLHVSGRACSFRVFVFDLLAGDYECYVAERPVVIINAFLRRRRLVIIKYNPKRWITWLVGRWRTQQIARQLVNCRTHEHRQFERTLRSLDPVPGPLLTEGRFNFHDCPVCVC